MQTFFFFDLFFYNFDETVPNFIRLLWENRILSQADKQNEPCWNRSSGLWLVVRVKKQQHFLTFSPENAAAFYFCK